MKLQQEVAKVKDIIEQNLYMTIATCNRSGKLPWISPLYYVSDSSYNFYWYSPKNASHSRFIARNPNIAVVIFNSTLIGDDVDAVYFRAKAQEITNKPEILKGLMLYGRKMLKYNFSGGKRALTRFINSYRDFQKTSPLRMYKAVPNKIWKLAPSEYYKDKYLDRKIEISLRNWKVEVGFFHFLFSIFLNHFPISI